MVSFRSLVTGAVALLAVPALAAITPAQMVENIKTLTVKSQALQGPAQSITIINTPLIIIGQGPFPVCLRIPYLADLFHHFCDTNR